MANPPFTTQGGAHAHSQPGPPGTPFGPQPPRNARGETPLETERRWLSNIAAGLLPFKLAGKLLKPKYRTGRPDPIMERVIRLRAWLGLAVVFTVFLRVFYDRKKEQVPGLPTPQSAGLPGAGPVGDALAAGPAALPQATTFPTGFPTNFPTGLPTNFPTGLPSNFPTRGIPTGGTLPTGPGTTPKSSGFGDMGGTAQDIQAIVYDIAGAVIHRIILAPILCALGLVLLGGLLVIFAQPHKRQQTLRQLWHPMRVILLFCLIPAAGALLHLLLRKFADIDGTAMMLNRDGSGLQLAASWAAAYVSAWSVFFAIAAMWHITRHLFAAIDGHPMLPGLLAVWLCWTLTVNDMTLKLGDGWLEKIAPKEDIVPDNVKAAVAILGCVVITVLALWEFARLDKWNGVNLRSGPFGNRA